MENVKSIVLSGCLMDMNEQGVWEVCKNTQELAIGEQGGGHGEANNLGGGTREKKCQATRADLGTTQQGREVSSESSGLWPGSEGRVS
jgi:hypothetical protein